MISQSTKLIFKTPRIYKSKIFKLQTFTEKDNPIFFVNTVCNLKGLESVIIIHKSLKFAAEFELPDKILVDFRNSLNYILLCLAHEYTHLLLRANILLNYSVEQSLAILLQLTYEDSAGIRQFDQKTCEELMRLMNVWTIGKILLKNWPSYWNLQATSRKKKHSNILIWVKKIINDNKIK